MKSVGEFNRIKSCLRVKIFTIAGFRPNRKTKEPIDFHPYFHPFSLPNPSKPVLHTPFIFSGF